MSDSALNAPPTKGPLLAWVRSASAVVIVCVLAALGAANIALYSRWHDVEDGVLWQPRAEGITATEVAPGSAAAAAGIERGDLLLAVNGAPIETVGEVTDALHRGHDGS